MPLTWFRPAGMRSQFHVRVRSLSGFGVDTFEALCGRTVFGRRRVEGWHEADASTPDTAYCVSCRRRTLPSPP